MRHWTWWEWEKSRNRPFCYGFSKRLDLESFLQKLFRSFESRPLISTNNDDVPTRENSTTIFISNQRREAQNRTLVPSALGDLGENGAGRVVRFPPNHSTVCRRMNLSNIRPVEHASKALVFEDRTSIVDVWEDLKRSKLFEWSPFCRHVITWARLPLLLQA
jgi:hypothetical protein